MDSSSLCHNRRSHRSKVLLAATLEEFGASRPVKLRNLSAEGALVEGAELPPEGTEVTFRRNELSCPGRVVWVNCNHAGIAFDTKLDPEQVLRHVPMPRPKVQPKLRRPGLKNEDMTLEERILAESWVWSPSVERPGE